MFPEGQDAVLKAHCQKNRHLLVLITFVYMIGDMEELSEVLPTVPIQKSKLSSDASFLLDFNRPWRFTIFKFSEENMYQRAGRSFTPDYTRVSRDKLVIEVLLTVQTHQHSVSLQLGDMDCIYLLVACRKTRVHVMFTGDV